MNRWFILFVMVATMTFIVFFYSPVGIIASMLTAGIASLIVGKLQDPMLWFLGMFFLSVLIVFVLFWFKLKRKNRSPFRILGSVIVALLLVAFLVLTSETNPAYKPYKTTWNGRPALGWLHRDGNYSFYTLDGMYICTLPAGEASKLH